jgi:hypothetical protein
VDKKRRKKEKVTRKRMTPSRKRGRLLKKIKPNPKPM